MCQMLLYLRCIFQNDKSSFSSFSLFQHIQLTLETFSVSKKRLVKFFIRVKLNMSHIAGREEPTQSIVFINQKVCLKTYSKNFYPEIFLQKANFFPCFGLFFMQLC